MTKIILVIVALCVASVWAQSSTCSSSSISCGSSGSLYYNQRNYTYNSTTGLFSGTLMTNGCPNWATSTSPNSGGCTTVTIPNGVYPITTAASRLETTGYNIEGGVTIKSVLEAGFSAGTFCTNQTTMIMNGADLMLTLASIQYQCPGSYITSRTTGVISECASSTNASCSSYTSKTTLMNSDGCGGHTSPYHIHEDLACDYNASDSSGHSALVGVMLDGRGLYGLWESSGVYAYKTLDACNGHYGNTPAYTTKSAGAAGSTVGKGVTFPAATNVYHYHTSLINPTLPGCFGPVTSLAAAQSMITTCSTTTKSSKWSTCTTLGYTDYVLNCPIFHHYNSTSGTTTWANQYTSSTSCPCTSSLCATVKATTSSTLEMDAEAESVESELAANFLEMEIEDALY